MYYFVFNSRFDSGVGSKWHFDAKEKWKWVQESFSNDSMFSQNDSIKRVEMTLYTSVNPKEVKMNLLKGFFWGQENDSFEGVKMTLLN